jgi:penicillin-binding protein 1A
VTLSQSLALSLNTVAARLQQDVGVRKVVEVARRLGIRSEIAENPTLALGTSDVSLMELTGAYGAIAAGGVAVEPHIIKAVRTSSGRVLYRRGEKQRVPIIAPDHVSMLSGMLAAVVREGTARRAAIPGHPTAGKTGTTQDHRDAWFVGYTAHLVGGVWVGNDNGHAMTRVTGGSLPARIWLEAMSAAHARLPSQPLKGVPHSAASRPGPAESPTASSGPPQPRPPAPRLEAMAAKRTPAPMPAPVSRSIPADPLGAMRGLPPAQPADVAPKTFDPDAIARLIDNQPVGAGGTPARPPGMMSLGNRP